MSNALSEKVTTFDQCISRIVHMLKTVNESQQIIGRLLIVVPNFGGWWARITGVDWEWLNIDDHHYHFTAAALKKLLEQTGFCIESLTTYSAFAPSLVQVTVSQRNVYDWPIVRWWLLRSLLYRVSQHSGLISNRVADLLGKGAELELLARPM